MTIRKEQEYILQAAARQDLLGGRIDRREFLTRSLVAGLSLAGISAAAKNSVGQAWAQDRPLTPNEYQQLADVAERNVREPEQQLQFYMKRALSRRNTPPKPEESTR